MSFKCSVFGHKFGDPVVDREREEAGSEVVITIRETQTCSRCGEERVVSENKEVTTLETPAEASPGARSRTSASATTEGGPAETSVETSAEADATETASTGEETAGDGPGGATTDSSVADADAEMDDATIIEESPEESIVDEAEPDDVTTPVESVDSAVGSGGDPGAAEDDAVILDDTDDEDTAEDREPGEWPSEPAADGPDWSPATDAERVEQAGGDGPAASVEPAGEAVTVPEGTFRCPECGFTTEVEASSLREGDFCPDCHTGTLVHEADAE